MDRWSRMVLAVMGSMAGIASWNTPAFAEAPSSSPALALDKFYSAPAGDRMFAIESPYVAGHLVPHAMLLVDYAHNPVVLPMDSKGEDRTTVVESQVVMHANVTFSLWNRINLNLDVPAALFQSGPSSAYAGSSFNSTGSAGFGDLRAGLRIRLWGNDSDVFQLALSGYVWFPTGSADDGSFSGEGTVRGLPQLVIGGKTSRLAWAFNVGSDLRAPQTFGNVTYGSSIRFGGGIGVLLGEERAFQVGPEFFASVVVDNPNHTPMDQAINAELLLDARYRFLTDFEVGVGAGPGMTSGIGTPDFRAVAMMSYSMGTRKTVSSKGADGDSMMDRDDACPTLDGVPALDRESHGCPSSEAPKDTDGDYVPDAEDACPTVSGLPSAEPKQNGCPLDSDEDSIPDVEDACRMVKGVAHVEAKKNGCPKDSDDDTIPDDEDACVDIKGLRTTDATTNGCPGDMDGDAFRDDQDACPEERGKANADPKLNGCPVTIRLNGNEIELLKQVKFDMSRATIHKTSNSLLDEVAGLMLGHPDFTKIEVQGHTDDTGPPVVNRKLSQERAESVKKALVARGVAEERLVAKGYGADKPVFNNRTEMGRQKNRRVQLIVLGKSQKAEQKPLVEQQRRTVIRPLSMILPQ